MRRLIRTVIEKQPGLKVVFEACNGQEAVDNFATSKADIIIMDVEMPILDGIDATRAIRRLNRSIPILMFSSLTSNGAEATLDALSAGANDVVVKPSAAGHISQAMAQLANDLIPKITQLTKRSIAARPKSDPPSDAISSGFETNDSPCVKAVAIGVSTGGPDALVAVLKDIPSSFSAPIIIAQHMPPVFTKLLAERLSARCPLPVREAKDGDTVEPGQVLLAPGDYHMTVVREGTQVIARLNQDPPENSCRPSVDPLFRSVATCYGKHALGLVLTGMGKDGMDGARLLKQEGSCVIAQDRETSVVWGMPGKVVEAGYADSILPLDKIGEELTRLTTAKSPATIAV
jgi:two-component system chemotaxis response regulator CheB